MANAIEAAMQAYDKLKSERPQGEHGMPEDLDEDDVIIYALIGIGQELSIANGIALASLLDEDDLDRAAILGAVKHALLD